MNNMKTLKSLFSPDKVASFILYFSILVFIIAFNFSDNPPGGWYQQFLPEIGNRQISDIEFLDSLTGIAVAIKPSDTSYILKSTNGGDNWQIIFRNFYAMNRLQFLNLNTGYACGGYLYKTTNEGISWSKINTPSVSTENMYVLNEDTIWFVNSDGLVGGVYITTNGGTSWTRQLNLGTLNPDHIYMYNARIGFICRQNSYVRKTTDGGQSWFVVVNNEGFTDMYFTDSLTGWRCGVAEDSIQHSTDGGLSWFKQTFFSTGGFFNVNQIVKFTFINRDTIWGVGARAVTTSGPRGLIYKSTNGGNNWGYQLPAIDSVSIGRYSFVDFTNRDIGWCYSIQTTSQRGVHTLTGGDTTYYTSVKQIGTHIPNDYSLAQNYPNPFNPGTKIKFRMKKSAMLIISVTDISGKKLANLANQELNSGEYEIEFDGSPYSSGIYLYSMIVNGMLVDSKKMILLK